MKARIIGAAAVGCLALAAPAQATTPKPTVTVTTDAANCVARVDVSWTGKTGTAGVQVNIDNHGAQDNAKQLNNSGDTLVATPGSSSYTFTLSQGQAHSVHGWTQGHGVKAEQFANMDCTTPVPPTVVEVPVEKRVEVPVEVVRNVPGPTNTVTKLVRVRTKCDLKMKNGRKVFYNCRKKAAVKPDCKAPKRWHPGLKRCFTPRKAKRQPSFTG